MTHDELVKVRYLVYDSSMYEINERGVGDLIGVIHKEEYANLLSCAPHLYQAVCFSHSAITELANHCDVRLQKNLEDILKILETTMLAAQQGTVKIGEQLQKEMQNGR